MNRHQAQHLLLRVVYGLIIIWAAWTLTFLILYVLPGDPVATMLSGSGQVDASPEEIEELRQQYGLDKSLPGQYLAALGGLLTGDLGTSYMTGETVTASLAETLPTTLQLAVTALVIGGVVGTALAVAAVAATTSRSPRLRRLGDGLAGLPVLGVSLPIFWIGLIMLQIFSFQLGWVPALGSTGIAGLILPAITLATPVAAHVGQVLQRSLTASWQQQFTTTFRAAGYSTPRLLTTHALRASLGPVLAIGGVLTGQLLSGTVVVETVFTRNGLGRLLVTSVTSQDIPVVLGVVTVSAVIFVIVNIVTDLLLPVVDARTRVSAPAGKTGNTDNTANKEQKETVPA
ncbi:ABC transporter permease [Corynebacterium glyciniphilum]|uniref:ABC-type oligopeptide/dipeptide transporter, permease subunit n=1 Tax=Corynebacterium glyciniphilum AJ 3170 TaxID=1404245 RepID=X5DXP8_9CORY|nr:ABC transporter permease [Corynebacterium glyciniphilum]AHW65347.1 ABC-type oligopeptide/dipeptide transporter, permease subunit [Corynebacterium glyciniphilum AJ 3170]